MFSFRLFLKINIIQLFYNNKIILLPTNHEPFELHIKFNSVFIKFVQKNKIYIQYIFRNFTTIELAVNII